MKTKNLILALAAIVFAVGSAFTTKNAAPLTIAKVWYKQTINDPFECRSTSVSCNDNAAGVACRVTVQTDNGPETVLAHTGTFCTSDLKHQGGEGIAGTYDITDDPYDVANLENGN